MHKEEFFVSQNVITQGEQDDRYFVLRRGKVEVHIDGVGVVSTLQWGMGFGEVALVLGTTRTATIRCKTPCEVYVLNRAQYESVVVSLHVFAFASVKALLANVWRYPIPSHGKNELVETVRKS